MILAEIQLTEKERSISFAGGENWGDIIVIPKCPICAKYIKTGKVKGNGRLHFEGWICKQHGEIEPPFITL
jgi:hypothetical protein